VARSRHPKKELEDACREIEAAGWTVTRNAGYFRARCSCGQHSRSIHLSPSDPAYGRNLLRWCSRQPCWPKESH
jgi:hypothetical protein